MSNVIARMSNEAFALSSFMLATGLCANVGLIHVQIVCVCFIFTRQLEHILVQVLNVALQLEFSFEQMTCWLFLFKVFFLYEKKERKELNNFQSGRPFLSH